MTIRLGYTADSSGMPGSIFGHEPSFHPVRTNFPGSAKVNKCPAINDYYWSAFDFYVPYDLCFTVNELPGGDFSVSVNNTLTTLSPQWLRNAFDLTFAPDGIVQVSTHASWCFISDDPSVIVTQLPADRQTNPHPIRGQFDCYNWCRPLTYAFKFSPGDEIFISSGSPIFQAKFYHPTEHRFTLQECEFTDVIRKMRLGAELRDFNRKTDWRKVFAFAKTRRPKKVIEFIKEAKVI